ncbi:MetQ/NlpA family ABC transporter substrate-binding protein [Acinetobacter apis]
MSSNIFDQTTIVIFFNGYLFMNLFKKFAFTLGLTVVASSTFANQSITVGATETPHGVILESIKPQLAKQGIDLKIKIYPDFEQANVDVATKKIDASYIVYRPYIARFNTLNKTNLVSVVPVHIEPFILYSNKVKSLKEVPYGAMVVIANDVVDTGRALLLLNKLNLITLKSEVNHYDALTDKLPTVQDITSNPKNLEIRQYNAEKLADIIKITDFVILNGNIFLQEKLNKSNVLYMERGLDGKNIWAEYLVTRPNDVNDVAVKKVAQALNSQATKDFINKTFKGEISPAF